MEINETPMWIDNNPTLKAKSKPAHNTLVHVTVLERNIVDDLDEARSVKQ